MKKLFLTLSIVLLSACSGTNFSSSVPSMPVRIDISILGKYVHFTPNNAGAYLEFLKPPKKYTEAYGYAGVVVYVTMDARYVAFDLCCPHCLNPAKPCRMDNGQSSNAKLQTGIYAICPTCGEAYDLSYGLATPTNKNLKTKEALRQYNASYNSATGILRIVN